MGFLSDRAKTETEGSSALYFNVNKIQVGKSHRIRIMSEKPLEGYMIWGTAIIGEGRKVFRFSEPPSAADLDKAFGKEYMHGTNSYTGEPDTIDFFIAVAIWDYQAESIKIMEIKQKTLMRGIEEVASREEYDPIQAWDLDIKREEKSYAVLPLPIKAATAAQAVDAWESNPVDLAAALQVIPVGTF
jgi:hypothetical protein